MKERVSASEHVRALDALAENSLLLHRADVLRKNALRTFGRSLISSAKTQIFRKKCRFFPSNNLASVICNFMDFRLEHQAKFVIHCLKNITLLKEMWQYCNLYTTYFLRVIALKIDLNQFKVPDLFRLSTSEL